MLHNFFEYFIKKHGTPDNCMPLSNEEHLKVRSVFPSHLAEFYTAHGRCILRSGRLQLCHPNDLEPVLKLALKSDRDLNSNSVHAFAYTAFGDIYFFHEKYGCGSIELLTGNVFNEDLTSPPPLGSDIKNSIFVPFSLSNESLDTFDTYGKPLFSRAHKALGPLGVGDCYGFVPALELGGDPSIECLKKLRAPEHFSIISQLKTFNLIKTLDHGQTTIERQIG